MTQFTIYSKLPTFLRRDRTHLAPTLSLTLALVSFLVVSMLAFGLFAATATAEELGPEAPGSIAGVVKAPDGAPQGGIQITLFNRTGNEVQTITTQADGSYRFSLLPAAIYRIGMSRAQTGYAPLYYPAAPTFWKAAEINVAGNQVTGIDLLLQPVGQIAGTITATHGFTLTAISVSLLQQGRLPSISFWETIQTINLPAAGGVYTFTGLSADTYLICASGFNVALSTYECYDNVSTVERASLITLPVGAKLSNINLVLGDNADYPEIRGLVTSPNGEPLAGIDVYAMFIPPAMPPYPTVRSKFIVPTATSPSPPIFDPNYGTSFAIRTDLNGNYQFRGLNEGRYRLFFSDATGVHRYEYYNDALLMEQATLIDIASGQVVSTINAQLEPGSQIEGAITLLGQPALSGRVVVETKTPLGWQYVVNGLAEFKEGHYRIGGLPPGVYRVSASSQIYDGMTSYEYSGYFGGKTAATATAITLGVGEAKQADMTLTGGPLFEGGISGRVTAGGSPLAGAVVALYKNPIICCTALLPSPQVYVFTNQNGDYTINGLVPGVYQLGVTDPTGIYATTYYTGQAVPMMANNLIIRESKVVTNVNVNLPLAGAIQGRATTIQGQPVAGLSVLVYANLYADRNVDLSYLVASGVQTDENGQYRIKGLHAGKYNVCFLGRANNVLHCHGALYALDPSSLFTNARPVTLAAGETKLNVDLLWGPARLYYLPIIAR